MTETDTGADILSFLRTRFNRVDEKLDRMAADLHDIKIRMTAVELAIAESNASIAGVNSRIDRIDGRLDRIEKRQELVDETA